MLPASIKVLMEAVVSICPTLLMFVSHLKKIIINSDSKPISNSDFNVANVIFYAKF